MRPLVALCHTTPLSLPHQNFHSDAAEAAARTHRTHTSGNDSRGFARTKFPFERRARTYICPAGTIPRRQHTHSNLFV